MKQTGETRLDKPCTRYMLFSIAITRAPHPLLYNRALAQFSSKVDSLRVNHYGVVVYLSGNWHRRPKAYTERRREVLSWMVGKFGATGRWEVILFDSHLVHISVLDPAMRPLASYSARYWSYWEKLPQPLRSLGDELDGYGSGTYVRPTSLPVYRGNRSEAMRLRIELIKVLVPMRWKTGRAHAQDGKSAWLT